MPTEFRRLLQKIVSKKNKKEIVKAGEEISEEKVKQIVDGEVTEVIVRSPITANWNMAFALNVMVGISQPRTVGLGIPVGIIAAKSIGTWNSVNYACSPFRWGSLCLDVTQGLPRVEELFEMRTPKNLITGLEITGKVTVDYQRGWLCH